MWWAQGANGRWEGGGGGVACSMICPLSSQMAPSGGRAVMQPSRPSLLTWWGREGGETPLPLAVPHSPNREAGRSARRRGARPPVKRAWTVRVRARVRACSPRPNGPRRAAGWRSPPRRRWSRLGRGKARSGRGGHLAWRAGRAISTIDNSEGLALGQEGRAPSERPTKVETA